MYILKFITTHNDGHIVCAAPHKVFQGCKYSSTKHEIQHLCLHVLTPSLPLLPLYLLSPSFSLGMVQPLTKDPQQKIPLLPGIKAGGYDDVTACVEREEGKNRASVGECDGAGLLLESVQPVFCVFLHLERRRRRRW